MWRFLAILLSTGIFGAQILSAASTPNIPPGMALPAMQRVSSEVYVAQIAPDLWVHTTIGRLPDGSPYAANGAILEEGDHSILFDVGWTPEQAETLLKWARIKLKHPVTKAYVTHFHNDRVGGIPALESTTFLFSQLKPRWIWPGVPGSQSPTIESTFHTARLRSRLMR